MNTDTVQNVSPSEEKISSLAGFFGVFGDVTRLKIMLALSDSPKNVGEIAESIGMNVSAVSHQLSLLKREKLLKSKRCGKTMCYSLSDSHIQEIIACGYEHITEENKI